MGADLPRCDIELLLTEHVASEDIDDAQDGDEDPCCDDEAPVGVAERFL